MTKHYERERHSLQGQRYIEYFGIMKYDQTRHSYSTDLHIQTRENIHEQLAITGYIQPFEMLLMLQLHFMTLFWDRLDSFAKLRHKSQKRHAQDY